MEKALEGRLLENLSIDWVAPPTLSLSIYLSPSDHPKSLLKVPGASWAASSLLKWRQCPEASTLVMAGVSKYVAPCDMVDGWKDG